MNIQRTTILVAAVLATVSFVPALAAQTTDPAWEGIPKNRRDAGLQRAEQQGLFAKLTLDDQGYVTGRFISFHYAAPIGVIHDFTVKHDDASAEVFDAITPTPFGATKPAYAVGSQFRVPNDNLTIRVHNNPAAMSGWHSKQDGLNLTFTLAAGATPEAGAAGKQVKINVGQRHGHILTNSAANLMVWGKNVSVVLAKNDTVLFVAHPGKGPKATALHTINALFVARRLGVLANIADGGGSAILDHLEVDANITVNRIGKGGLTIRAEGESSTPKVLIFTVDADTLDCDRRERIHIKLNGAAVANATGLEDVGEGGDAKVHVLCGDRLAMVIVKVPHFSTQTVDIDQDAEAASTGGTSPKEGAPGFGFAALVGAVVGTALLAARRGRRSA